jgi:hypothetical protein
MSGPKERIRKDISPHQEWVGPRQLLGCGHRVMGRDRAIGVGEVPGMGVSLIEYSCESPPYSSGRVLSRAATRGSRISRATANAKTVAA